MSDAKAHFVDSPPDPSDTSGPRPSILADDELATHRMSGTIRPPRPSPASSYPTTPPPPPSPESEPKASWWRALRSATLAPLAMPSRIVTPHHGRAMALRMAIASAALAMVLPFAALLACLWSVPSAASAGVAITVVVGRVTFALALLAFAVAILRAGERFLAASGAQGNDTDPR